MPHLHTIDPAKTSNTSHVVIDAGCGPLGFTHPWCNETPYPVDTRDLDGMFDPCNSQCQSQTTIDGSGLTITTNITFDWEQVTLCDGAGNPRVGFVRWNQVDGTSVVFEEDRTTVATDNICLVEEATFDWECVSICDVSGNSRVGFIRFNQVDGTSVLYEEDRTTVAVTGTICKDVASDSGFWVE